MSEQTQVAYRRATVLERSAVNREQRTVDLSFSSETPVRRSFGWEILDHSPESVRMGRLNSGAPALWHHNGERQDHLLGIVESAAIGEDRRGHAQVRMGRSVESERALLDAEDGILRNVSTGYILHDRPKPEAHIDGVPVFRFKDWEPYEISFTPIPADTAVGVGREFVPLQEASAAETATAAPAAIPTIEVRQMAEQQVQTPSAEALEVKRRDAIMALASDKDFSKHVSSVEVRDAFEKGMSVEVFSQMISRKLVSANDASKVGTAGENVMREAGRDAKRYSLARAHRYAINQARPGSFKDEDVAFEREVSQEIGKRLGVQTLGLLIPNSITRTVSAGSGSGLTAQTALVSTVTEPSVIEMYRNRPRVLALGATRLGGLSGIIRLPRQTGAGTFQWLAENASTTASDVTTDFVAITPRRGSIQNKYTVELLAESSPDVENLLANDRSKVTSLAVDFAAAAGPTGGASPVGVLNTTGLATFASTGTTLTNGKALSYNDWLEFESIVAAANADSASCGFLLTPEVRAQAKGTPMFPSGYAMPIWSSNQRDPDGLEVGPLGYKAGVTNQLPKNFGTGTNLHAVVFGDWSQVIVADYGASELIVDPYTAAGQGVFVVTERVLMDVQVRHIAAFAACETVALS